jgi:non-reducing end alpha-L-arabinofuranosidase
MISKAMDCRGDHWSACAEALRSTSLRMLGILALVLGGGVAKAAPIGPCDIYSTGGTPCVAAHSTVRALYGAYSGNLYQVKNTSGGTKDIGVLAAGGVVNSATQDTFCKGTTCTISKIYDQSGKGNHLTSAPGGGAAAAADKEVVATKSKFNLDGHPAYAAYFEGAMGYRNNKTSGIATGDNPESMYMVTSGTHFNAACCFDYGNAETTNNDDGAGTMEAIYFGNCTWWGGGAGTTGPWVMADQENGLFAGNVTKQYTPNTAVPYPYVTAMIKGKPALWAIKAGNATTGTLKTMFEGTRPPGTDGKYPWNPMRKQGAIILGIGGDNSNGAIGTFYEGCMTTGYSTNATDSAIQLNIIAAGYGSATTSLEGGIAAASSATVRYDASTGVAVVGYVSKTSQHVRLRVVDLQGRVVSVLQDGMVQAGSHNVLWDAGRTHAGIYAVSLEADGRATWSGRIVVGR